MTSSVKSNNRLGDVLIRVCGYGLLISSAVKFLHPAEPVAYLRYLGFENGTLYFVAILELITSVLFLMRSTRSLGLLLVWGYLGGAIAAHIGNHPFDGTGNPFLRFMATYHYIGAIEPALFLVCGWIGVWLRHPESRWSFASADLTKSRASLASESRPSATIAAA